MNKNFQFEIKEDLACYKKIHVNISKEEVNRSYNQVSLKFNNYIKMPGFRKGKIPFSMIRSKYGKELDNSVKDYIFKKATELHLKDKKDLKILNAPIFDEQENISFGNNFIFTISYDIEPEFELKEYKNFDLSFSKKEVSQKEIDEVIENIAKQQAKYISVDRKIQIDDRIQISYNIVLNKVKEDDIPTHLTSLLSSDSQFMLVNKYSFIPNIDKKVISLKKDDEKSWSFVFDKNDSSLDEFLRAKKAKVSLKIIDIQEKETLTIDDSFAQNNGAENLKVLKENISQDLKLRNQELEQNEKRQAIVDKLLENLNIDLPNIMLENEIKKCTQQAKQEIAYSKKEDKSKTTDIEKLARENAEKNIKSLFICNKIAQLEKVTVEEKSLHEELIRISQLYGMNLKDLQKNKMFNEIVYQVHHSMLNNKVLDKLIEFSNFKEESK